MTKKVKAIIIASSVLIIATVFTLATMFDYQISEAIARLSDGKYISDSVFGKFIEVVGEAPAYIICCFAVVNFARACLFIKDKYLKVTLLVLCVIGGVFTYTMWLFRATEYAYEQRAMLDKFEEYKVLITAFLVVVSMALFSLTYYLTFKIPQKHLKGLILFSIICLLAVALSQGFAQFIKSIVGRQRYRMIKVLEYYGFNDLIDYTKWFEINGKRVVGEELLALGIAKDGYKSFPSGHTCAWSMLFALTILPDFLQISQKSRVMAKGVLYVATILLVLLMCYSRVLVGAHYLTDVLFAAMLTYMSIIVSKIICKKLIKIE